MPPVRVAGDRARDLGARLLAVDAQATESVRGFYDSLAAEYHLIYPDWRKAVARQGAVLDRLIRSTLSAERVSILDCACGIGTQAIGLALRGHRVVGTDISAASIERARAEAASFSVQVPFSVADMRARGDALDETFDVVMACDNSLPHLVTDDDLGAAARSFAARLHPGGLFVASTREYDRAVQARPSSTQPKVFDGPDGKRVVFQVWEWAPDGHTYEVRQFILREQRTAWQVTQEATTYRALMRAELNGILAAAGFDQIRWHTPSETGYFQQLVTARLT